MLDEFDKRWATEGGSGSVMVAISEVLSRTVTRSTLAKCKSAHQSPDFLPNLKSHGHSQPSNRGYTADRRRAFFRILLIFTLIYLRPQDVDVRLKTLRLVCSQFNRAFEAQVLSTLVIAVTNNTLKRSIDMLRMFASQNKKTSRAVQHARTLNIKYLSPMITLDPKRFQMPQPDELESQDSSSSLSNLINYLASAIFSLKQGFK